VLVAGTGAVAGAVRGRRVVGTADGHGWLLGDDGSGFWLGRQAARATLRVLDAAEPPGVLAASVLRALAPSDGAAPPSDPVAGRELVVGTVNGRPPIRLAELAPLVTAACAAGDPVAVRIVEEAAGLLARTLGRVRRDDEDTPLVLAGGLARPGTPVGEALRELVSARFQGPLLTAQDGAGGAAWLALADTAPDLATDAARERLIAASSPPPRRG
jgi:N-acetylglucosamine kinase-like BadF-type ATPase